MALLSSRRRFVGAFAMGVAGIGLAGCGLNDPGAADRSAASNDVMVVPLTTPIALSRASAVPASFVTPATAAAPAIVSPAATPIVPTPNPISAEAPSVKEGLRVGQKLPDFMVAGVNGKPISGADLSAQRKPYVLFFFATWCTECRAEFRLLKDLFPRYASQAAFIAADIDPSETETMVRDYERTFGFPWTFATAERSVLEKLNVTQTDTKYLVDRDGIIVYKSGWGAHDETVWRSALDKLVL